MSGIRVLWHPAAVIFSRPRGRRSPRFAAAPAALAGLALAFVVTTAAGCGPGNAGPPVENCPNDVPATCPSPAPTFAADAQPVFMDHCVKCHAPGGQEPSFPFQTYSQIQSQKITILGQIHTCLMPPAGEVALTSAERQAVLGWIVCGANND